MEPTSTPKPTSKSRTPLVVAVAVLAIVAGGLAVSLAFFLGRESSDEAGGGEPAATTTTTLAPDELAGLTEEELAALVNTVLAQVEESTAAVEAAAADAAAAESETETVEVVVSAEDLDELVAYAESLVDYYVATYGEYANAALAELQAIQGYLTAVSVATDEILALLASGEAGASDVAAEVQARVAAMSTSAGQLTGAADQWQSKLGSIRGQLEVPEPPDVSIPDVEVPATRGR